MVRLIKRYESRKLYDTEESRYVSLDEVARFVRGGQEVRIVDNASDEDVTAQTLTQVILEEGKNGRSQLSTEMLHDLVRKGEQAWKRGVLQMQEGVDRFVEASFDRLGPVRQAREEMDHLRARLEELESSLQGLEKGNGPAPRPASKPKAKAKAKVKAKAKTRKTTKTPSRSKSRSKAGTKKKSSAKRS